MTENIKTSPVRSENLREALNLPAGRRWILFLSIGLVLLAAAAVPSIVAAEPQQKGKSPEAATGEADEDLWKPGAIQPVDSVSFEGAEFTRAFNAASDRTRLVLVLSPS